MTRHHRHHETNEGTPHPAVVNEASEQAKRFSTNGDGESHFGKPGEWHDAQAEPGEPGEIDEMGESKSDQMKSDPSKGPSKGRGQGQDTVTPGGAWRSVAHKAGAKLSEVFDEARSKATKSAQDMSKRMAGVASENFDQAFNSVREQAKEMFDRGTGTQVRVKLREREITTLSIGALAAAEAASMWWFGPIRMMFAHFLGRAVLELELVSTADPHVKEARKLFAEGDIDDALKSIDQAVAADHTSAAAHLLRGTLLKIKGDKAGAKSEFDRAEECDSRGETGARARNAKVKLG